MSFQQALDKYFPNALPETDFVNQTQAALLGYGFTKENTLACIGLCRDEFVLSLVDQIHAVWGPSFTFSSLGGMLFLGQTGFSAAHAHAPIENGRARYIYFVMPHIAIDQNGEIGKCDRPGLPKLSEACGALIAFQRAMAAGPLDLALNPTDIEQSLLKQRLFPKINAGEHPDLIKLTRIAQEVIFADLEQMLEITIDPAVSDYAVFSGIQIHGPDHRQEICPGPMYVAKNAQRHDLTLAKRAAND